MKKAKAVDKETRNTIWLGLFVTLGLILLVIAVYFIGSKKNLFSSTIRVTAAFSDVNGLQSGDAVRFRGINVGTVKEIRFLNDSTIAVEIDLQKKTQALIKKNARASIATDGLMGNKLMILRNDFGTSASIAEHDTLQTVPPIDMERVSRKLTMSTDKISDVISNLSDITDGMKKGRGTLGALLTDTIMEKEIKKGANNLYEITYRLNKGKGTLGTLLRDTAMATEVKQSVKEIEAGATNIHSATEGLKRSFFFRRLFKKGEKK